MKVILFGGTGMVGQGVLRECLFDPGVERVLAIGRGGTGQTHDKLRDLVRKDLTDYTGPEGELEGYDACFFCLGIASAGMSEADYRRITHDIAVAAAKVLVKASPGMPVSMGGDPPNPPPQAPVPPRRFGTFVYVSGAGSDAASRTMWARVKGEAENAILALPFARAYAFRPAFIKPEHGITSRTASYRALYAVAGPLFPVLKAVFPRHMTTTTRVARAMLEAARHGAPKAVLENADIEALAEVAEQRSAAPSTHADGV
jgi:uncharacterized protein YbjT (DUF2867 family)